MNNCDAFSKKCEARSAKNGILKVPRGTSLFLRGGIFYFIIELPRVDGKRRYKRLDSFKSLECEYKTNVVCVKIKTIPGGKYVATNHSHLVIGTRGDYPSPESRSLESVLHESEIGDGIEFFKSRIERMFPTGKKLDLISETPLNSKWTICKKTEKGE